MTIFGVITDGTGASTTFPISLPVYPVHYGTVTPLIYVDGKVDSSLDDESSAANAQTTSQLVRALGQILNNITDVNQSMLDSCEGLTCCSGVSAENPAS